MRSQEGEIQQRTSKCHRYAGRGVGGSSEQEGIKQASSSQQGGHGGEGPGVQVTARAGGGGGNVYPGLNARAEKHNLVEKIIEMKVGAY